MRRSLGISTRVAINGARIIRRRAVAAIAWRTAARIASDMG